MELRLIIGRMYLELVILRIVPYVQITGSPNPRTPRYHTSDRAY